MPDSHAAFAAQRLMVMSAPNGARRTRGDHPALPMTPAQLAAEAQELLAVGVSVLHLHVRDARGRHSLDSGHYQQAIAAIRKAVGEELVLQVTSEAVGQYDRFQQMAMVRTVRPEAVSLALRELCPDQDSVSEAAAFYAFVESEGIWAQHILYNAEDLVRFEALRRQGVLGTDSPSCLLVLGAYQPPRAGGLGELADKLTLLQTQSVSWAACCFGENEHEVMLASARRGGHVRLGFENNMVLADGRIAANNAALISDWLTSADTPSRPLATAGEVRDHYLSN